MEKTMTVNQQYNSLDSLGDFLKTAASFECTKEYDRWEVRTDANGQMAQCIVLKKSSMHAVKIYFTHENTIQIKYVIPNSIMNAYFGKSVKARRNIIEIIAEKIKETILAPAQKKAFLELEAVINKAAM